MTWVPDLLAILAGGAIALLAGVIQRHRRRRGDGELHDHEEDCERERQRHEALQAARDIAREAYWRSQGGGQF